MSLQFEYDEYSDTEDLSFKCDDSEDTSQIRFRVQRSAAGGGALSTLVNPIEIRVIPVALDNFDRKRYPPPPNFPSEPQAESKCKRVKEEGE